MSPVKTRYSGAMHGLYLRFLQCCMRARNIEIAIFLSQAVYLPFSTVSVGRKSAPKQSVWISRPKRLRFLFNRRSKNSYRAHESYGSQNKQLSEELLNSHTYVVHPLKTIRVHQLFVDFSDFSMPS